MPRTIVSASSETGAAGGRRILDQPPQEPVGDRAADERGVREHPDVRAQRAPLVRRLRASALVGLEEPADERRGLEERGRLRPAAGAASSSRTTSSVAICSATRPSVVSASAPSSISRSCSEVRLGGTAPAAASIAALTAFTSVSLSS